MYLGKSNTEENTYFKLNLHAKKGVKGGRQKREDEYGKGEYEGGRIKKKGSRRSVRGEW